VKGQAIAMRRRTVLPRGREEVWRALTDPERLAEWFANDVELDLRPGGEGVFRWDDGTERRATVEEVDEERRFAFTWEEEGEGATRVEITLDDADGGTEVTVVESPAPQALQASADWSWGLTMLAHAPVHA
jgi:uncharacterized protein YndB with AHSA1/START domain